MKTKLDLTDLKVRSFVTNCDVRSMQTVKGGGDEEPPTIVRFNLLGFNSPTLGSC